MDLLRTRYFLLLAALVVFLNVGNYIVDFSFLSQVRGRFQGGTAIAQFIALFFGVTKTLELLAKVFLSGRLLTQFGLKFGLVAMPVLLAGCAGFAIAIGTLGLPAAHFFVLVALAKLVWIVSRTTTFEPAFRVFYQPVPLSTASRSRRTWRARRASSRSAWWAWRSSCGAAAPRSTPSPSSTRSCRSSRAGWWSGVLAHRKYREKLLDSLTRPGARRSGAARRLSCGRRSSPRILPCASRPSTSWRVSRGPRSHPRSRRCSRTRKRRRAWRRSSTSGARGWATSRSGRAGA